MKIKDVDSLREVLLEMTKASENLLLRVRAIERHLGLPHEANVSTMTKDELNYRNQLESMYK